MFRNIFVLPKIFIMRKMNSNIFTVSFVRLTHFKPQSATGTSFRTPIPTTLDFVLLGFYFLSYPEKFEKIFNSFIHSLIEFLSWRKKVVSTAEMVYKNSCLKMLKSLTLGLFLRNIKNISETSINKYANIGSPC